MHWPLSVRLLQTHATARPCRQGHPPSHVDTRCLLTRANFYPSRSLLPYLPLYTRLFHYYKLNTVEFQYKRNGGDRPIFRLYWNFAFIGILCSQTSLIRMSRYPVEILRNQLKNILVAPSLILTFDSGSGWLVNPDKPCLNTFIQIYEIWLYTWTRKWKNIKKWVPYGIIWIKECLSHENMHLHSNHY